MLAKPCQWTAIPLVGQLQEPQSHLSPLRKGGLQGPVATHVDLSLVSGGCPQLQAVASEDRLPKCSSGHDSKPQ